MKNELIIKLIVAILLLSVAVSPFLLGGEAVTVPGDANRLCHFSNFFYNFPTKDFLYYLNDRLLFSEPVDEKISPDQLRMLLTWVVAKHKTVKEYMATLEKDEKGRVTLNLEDPEQFKKAVELMNRLGRQLKKNVKGTYYLVPLTESKGIDYFKFSMLRAATLVQQMNRSKVLAYRLREAQIEIPRSLEFFKEVTGMPLDKESFFEALLVNERLSLLVGILYRLSEREINYIDNLDKTTKYGVWKKMILNKKWVMGMYILSHAMRVSSDGSRLLLPGGNDATAFWTTLAGENIKADSPEFLQQLAIKDEGKLNYLYVFSYFLSQETQKQLLLNFNSSDFKPIYDTIQLHEREKLNLYKFSALKDWNFFTLLYTIKAIKDRLGVSKLHFPIGIHAWIEAINKDAEPAGENNSYTLAQLFNQLLEGSDVNDKVSKIRTFMAIYTKFNHRPELLADGALALLFANYKKYNGLVDFIEKIPLKKPKTVAKLFQWVKKVEALNGKGEREFTVIYQSLFEILSFTARYAPKTYDYDILVTGLMNLPLERSKFYPQALQFLKKNLGLREGKKSLSDIMLTGVKNRMVKINGSNYLFMIKNLFKKNISEVMTAQESWKFTHFLEIQRLFNTALKLTPPANRPTAMRIQQLFGQLPYPGIGKKAPKHVRERVTPYSPAKFSKLVKKLVNGMHMGNPVSQLKEWIEEINTNYLFYQFRDHLMIQAYAVNAKNPKFRLFNNPNLVRLHDIEGLKGHSLWDNFGENKNPGHLSEYHLSGNMCRLKVTLSPKWSSQLFRENIIHNFQHVQALVVNLFDLYPIPRVNELLTYYALQVKLGLEILNLCPEDEAIADEIRKILPTITSGFHYRKTMAFIDGKTDEHNLFFSEIRRLAEAYMQKGKNLDSFEKAKTLKKYETPAYAKKLAEQKHRFGNSYFHTFGNLEPVDMKLFPQELGNLFADGWLSGGLVDEYKVKLALQMNKKKTPSLLMGQLLHMYLDSTGRRFLRQNHTNDYPISYLIFDIFNNSHMKREIKLLQKKGYLRLN
jgi:hypothetical protein